MQRSSISLVFLVLILSQDAGLWRHIVPYSFFWPSGSGLIYPLGIPDTIQQINFLELTILVLRWLSSLNLEFLSGFQTPFKIHYNTEKSNLQIPLYIRGIFLQLGQFITSFAPNYLKEIAPVVGLFNC